MTTRDELADLIQDHVPGYYPDHLAAADAILARWRLVPVEEGWQVNITECQACQHSAADELTQHDQAAGHYE